VGAVVADEPQASEPAAKLSKRKTDTTYNDKVRKCKNRQHTALMITGVELDELDEIFQRVTTKLGPKERQKPVSIYIKSTSICNKSPKTVGEKLKEFAKKFAPSGVTFGLDLDVPEFRGQFNDEPDNPGHMLDATVERWKRFTEVFPAEHAHIISANTKPKLVAFAEGVLTGSHIRKFLENGFVPAEPTVLNAQSMESFDDGATGLTNQSALASSDKNGKQGHIARIHVSDGMNAEQLGDIISKYRKAVEKFSYSFVPMTQCLEGVETIAVDNENKNKAGTGANEDTNTSAGHSLSISRSAVLAGVVSAVFGISLLL